MRAPHAPALAALLLLVAGCVAPGAALEPVAPGDAAPLPEPIHDERQVLASTSGATANLACGEVRACVDHAFALPRSAQLDATLAWSVAGNILSLRVIRADGDGVAWVGSDVMNPTGRTSLAMNVTLPAGEYVLRVDAWTTAADTWILDAAFSEAAPWATTVVDPPTFGPHVVIGVSDTGINPYHQLFYRPHLTAHPCTYIRDMPCDLRELPLSVGMDDWNAAVEKDRALWDAIEPGVWYWIPKTMFVAVMCGEIPVGSLPVQEGEDVCILDDFNAHGAMTTSILAMQNPEAYVAFHAGGPVAPLAESGIPIDLYSVSLASYIPGPVPSRVDPCGDPVPLYFAPAGNLAWSPILHCGNSRPDKIIVGGGYTDPYAVDAESGDLPEVTSYFCPPYAPEDRVFGLEPAGSWCGTSFATPTVAGAVSKAILEVRRASGYDGGLTAEGMIDPILGIGVDDVRDALNLTATYAPEPKHAIPPAPAHEPLNPAAPWLQWGWGFYDVDQVDATVAHLLGTAPAPEKASEIRAFMEAQYAFRQTMYG